MRKPDPKEVELLQEVESARIRLTSRAEALGNAVRSSADPLNVVRRNPFGILAGALVGGVLLGAFMPSARGSRGETGNGASHASSLLPLLTSLIPAVLPLIVNASQKQRQS